MTHPTNEKELHLVGANVISNIFMIHGLVNTTNILIWLQRLHDDRPCDLLKVLREICEYIWPSAINIYDNISILKVICVQQHSVVKLVSVQNRFLIMKECISKKAEVIEEHVCLEIIIHAYFSLLSHLPTSIPICEGICLRKHATYIFTEYIPLYHHTVFEIISIEHIIYITFSIAKILLELERIHGIAHRDIKITNIAYRPSGEVVLLDFDNASFRTDGRSDEDAVCTVTTRAPEIFAPTQTYCMFKAQVWSLGILMCEMILKANIFNSTQWNNMPYHIEEFVTELNHINSVRTKYIKTFLARTEIYECLLKMLTLDPSHRISMEHLEQKFRIFLRL